MGMSTHLEFYRAPSDPDMNRKIDAAYACEAAGVSVPAELRKFLDPVYEEYGHLPADREDAVRALLLIGGDWRERQSLQESFATGECAGFDVDLSQVPAGTARIVFRNSW